MKEKRKIIFISHASPEDSQFCCWLSLQLTRRGYAVWCDVIKLIGGEKWWEDIDTAIRQATCKFIFVASRISVKKPGVIRELKIAKEIAANVSHFVIPIKLDSVPYGDFPENIGSEINAVDFSKGWAPGLAQLLKRFEDDSVPQDSDLNAATVGDYWRKSFPSQEGVKNENEEYSSNWFPIETLPSNIWIHSSHMFGQGKITLDGLNFPHESHSDCLITFGSPDELRNGLRNSGGRFASNEIDLQTFLTAGSDDYSIKRTAARNFMQSILRKAWDANAIARGFQQYELANQNRCYYHLSKEAAQQLVEQAVQAYQDRNNGHKPSELFIHGKTRFNKLELEGFKAGGGSETKVVGVRIVTDRDLRLYHPSKTPILRGMAWLQDPKTAYVWTRGFVPRLQTYPGRETPLPLNVEISEGNADIETVAKDILALTKLNYNSCRYADGLPVTLRFADAVGEILVSGPAKQIKPLAFRYYI